MRLMTAVKLKNSAGRQSALGNIGNNLVTYICCLDEVRVELS